MKLTTTSKPNNWGLGFGRLSDWDNEFDRFFSEPFGLLRTGDTSTGWMPALDFYEEGDDLVVNVELPGLKRDEIHVNLHDGVLTISGERKHEDKRDENGVYHTERYHGRFSRSVKLHTPVDQSGIKASYKDGMLTVRLPKAEEAKPRQIEIK